MPLIPSYVSIASGALIAPGPVNTSFAQLYNILNNANGNGLDFNNVGNAGVNAALFTTGLIANPFTTGAFTFNQTTVQFAGQATIGASAQNLSSSHPSGSILFGRSNDVAVAVFGGSTTSAAISYNATGLFDLRFSAPVVAGYQGSAGTGRLLPAYTATGTDAGLARAVISSIVITTYPATDTLSGAAQYSNTQYYCLASSSTQVATSPYSMQPNVAPVSGSSISVKGQNAGTIQYVLFGV